MARGRRTGSARARESGDYENANGDSARVRVTEDPARARLREINNVSERGREKEKESRRERGTEDSHEGGQRREGMDAGREGEREITSRASVGKSEGERFPEGSRGRKSALAMKARERGERDRERERGSEERNRQWIRVSYEG